MSVVLCSVSEIFFVSVMSYDLKLCGEWTWGVGRPCTLPLRQLHNCRDRARDLTLRRQSTATGSRGAAVFIAWSLNDTNRGPLLTYGHNRSMHPRVHVILCASLRVQRVLTYDVAAPFCPRVSARRKAQPLCRVCGGWPATCHGMLRAYNIAFARASDRMKTRARPSGLTSG